MSNKESYTEELLSSESRYKMNLNVIDYDGCKMYDIPYEVSQETQLGDQYLSVTSSYENHLDKISYEYYGSSKYWWLVGQLNKVDNPFDVPIDSLMRITNLSNLILEGVLT